MEGSSLRTTVAPDGVAEVTLADPERHNALTPALFAELADTAGGLARDDAVRAVVLSGEGPSFCSGLDFASVTDELRPGLVEPTRPSGRNLIQDAALGWAEMPATVIAAVHGHALGAGLQLALAADVRIAHPDARLSAREVAFGRIPDMGLSLTLPPLVRGDHARELVLTGRTVDGPEALALGLVTRLDDDPLAAARELARAVAATPSAAPMAAKRLLNEAYGRPEELLALERGLQAELREAQ